MKYTVCRDSKQLMEDSEFLFSCFLNVFMWSSGNDNRTCLWKTTISRGTTTTIHHWYMPLRLASLCGWGMFEDYRTCLYIVIKTRCNLPRSWHRFLCRIYFLSPLMSCRIWNYHGHVLRGNMHSVSVSFSALLMWCRKGNLMWKCTCRSLFALQKPCSPKESVVFLGWTGYGGTHSMQLFESWSVLEWTRVCPIKLTGANHRLLHLNRLAVKTH